MLGKNHLYKYDTACTHVTYLNNGITIIIIIYSVQIDAGRTHDSTCHTCRAIALQSPVRFSAIICIRRLSFYEGVRQNPTCV